MGQGSDTSYTSGTQLAQPLTQILRIRESNRAAAADVAVSKIHVTQAENDVILRVRQLYFNSLIAQLKFEAAQQQLKASEMTYQEDAESVGNGRMLEVTALEGHAPMLDAKQEVLTQKLQLHDLMLALDDALGLPLSTQLVLSADTSEAILSLPTREECVRAALAQSTWVLEAQQAVTKAKAGLAAARDAYVPDVTGLARYSYQSGVPLLVHNFGSFGFSLTYDLFDGGRRSAETKVARTALAEAQVNLDKIQHEVEVAVESSYDRVEQLHGVLDVAKESLDVRSESARLADRRIEQDAALESNQAEAHAKVTAAKAGLLEATLGVSLAQADLMRIMGKAPR
nr:TolC family protein [Granulicella pectinivorans]